MPITTTRSINSLLSIYPQALKGCIQLSESKNAPGFLAKYRSKDITGSPYNTMPDAAGHNHFLLLDKNRFYALSWMIAELGKLKDNGLRLEVTLEALLQASPVKEKEALAKAKQYGGPGQLTIQQVLDRSEALFKTYCREKNLEALIAGSASVTK